MKTTKQELIDFYDWVWSNDMINTPLETEELVEKYLESINPAPPESPEQTLAIPVIGGFSIVPEDKEFKFKGLCPYCQGDLTYQCNGWEQDESGLWMADSFDMSCSTEPDIDSEDWEDWMNIHSYMPYVNQLPVDQRVKASINKHYRFNVR